MEAIDLIKKIDFEDDKSIMKAIKKLKSNIYTGKDQDGNTIVVSIQSKEAIQISTYQSNGWIRINNYYLIDDEIIRSESYEK